MPTTQRPTWTPGQPVIVRRFGPPTVDRPAEVVKVGRKYVTVRGGGMEWVFIAATGAGTGPAGAGAELHPIA